MLVSSLGRRAPLLAALTSCAFASSFASAAGPINAKYYNPGDYSEVYGSGIAFTGTPFATSHISELNEYSDPDPRPGNSDPNFPSANLYFAADYTSYLSVVTAGTYTFSETSDDAGYLFIDGSLLASTPGNHLPSTASNSLFLTAGLHSFEFQMANAGGPCCAEALVQLPSDVSYSAGTTGAVPEPASWAMFIGGFGLIGGAMRNRRTRVRFA